MERRLAAILMADVVGYSRLMDSDESRTHSALKAQRAQIVDPAVARNHGRCIKLMGDGALFEFPSAVDAVSCAIDIQTTLSERGGDAADDERIELRLGIHVGDVIVTVVYGIEPTIRANSVEPS